MYDLILSSVSFKQTKMLHETEKPNANEKLSPWQRKTSLKQPEKYLQDKKIIRELSVEGKR